MQTYLPMKNNFTHIHPHAILKQRMLDNGEDIEDCPIRAEIIKIGTYDEEMKTLSGFHFGRCLVMYDFSGLELVYVAGYTIQELLEIIKNKP